MGSTGRGQSWSGPSHQDRLSNSAASASASRIDTAASSHGPARVRLTESPTVQSRTLVPLSIPDTRASRFATNALEAGTAHVKLLRRVREPLTESFVCVAGGFPRVYCGGTVWFLAGEQFADLLIPVERFGEQGLGRVVGYGTQVV